MEATLSFRTLTQRMGLAHLLRPFGLAVQWQANTRYRGNSGWPVQLAKWGAGGVTTPQRDELSQTILLQDVMLKIFRLPADTKVSQRNQSFHALQGKAEGG